MSNSSRKKRVLLISHTCQSRREGQPKAQFLGETADIELCLWVPDRWKAYGTWHRAQKPEHPSFDFRVGRVMWPWCGPGQTYLHWYPALPALLRRFRPDIIDLWEEPWSLISAQACFWRNRLLPNAKIIAETEQNVDKTLPPPFEQFRSYVLKNADFVVGRNLESLAIVGRKGYAGPSRVVPNAVDTDLFEVQNRVACRQKLGLDGFLVGYVGRLVEEKGLDDLLMALTFLPLEAQVVLVGSGPYEAALRALAGDKGLAERVHFLGARPLEELPPLFGALDAFVLPSRTTPSWKEQFGRVLIEAGACGVPVVGSSSGAIPEVIGTGSEAMGLIFLEGDAQALSQALLRLKDEPNLAQSMGGNGERRARAQFSWQQVTMQMAQIYREIGT